MMSFDLYKAKQEAAEYDLCADRQYGHRRYCDPHHFSRVPAARTTRGPHSIIAKSAPPKSCYTRPSPMRTMRSSEVARKSLSDNP